MFVLVIKLLPEQPGGNPRYRMGYETYWDKEEAERAAYEPIKYNYPFRCKVIEIENPWLEEMK